MIRTYYSVAYSQSWKEIRDIPKQIFQMLTISTFSFLLLFNEYITVTRYNISDFLLHKCWIIDLCYNKVCMLSSISIDISHLNSNPKRHATSNLFHGSNRKIHEWNILLVSWFHLSSDFWRFFAFWHNACETKQAWNGRNIPVLWCPFNVAYFCFVYLWRKN